MALLKMPYNSGEFQTNLFNNTSFKYPTHLEPLPFHRKETKSIGLHKVKLKNNKTLGYFFYFYVCFCKLFPNRYKSNTWVTHHS